MSEVEPDIVGVVDPLDEVGHSPVKNLIHNYPDRVAFCVTAECADLLPLLPPQADGRRRRLHDAEGRTRRGARLHPPRTRAIRDVLLTGGDPLVFNEANLDWLLGRAPRDPARRGHPHRLAGCR